ncbi:hypothetical protein D9M71_472450 [compost metagenome]
MHRATVADQLPIDLGRVHLGLEGRQLLLGHKRVSRTVQYQHRCLDLALLRRQRRVERAMEGHCRQQACIFTRQLQCTASAKAEAEGAQLGWLQHRLRLPQQLIQRCFHAFTQLNPVILQRHHRRTCFIHVRRSQGLPVDIGEQHHIPLGSNLAGNPLGAFADPHPVRRHQQTRLRLGVMGIKQAALIGFAGNMIDQRFDGNLAHALLLAP